MASFSGSTTELDMRGQKPVARPITALPDPPVEPVHVPVNPLPGYWERDVAHFPDPLCPIIRSEVLPVHERAFYEMCRAMSLPMDGVQFREIGGWVYQRTVPPGGKDMAPPPAWLMPLLVRVVPQMRQLVKGMTDVIRENKPGKNAERWYTEWKPEAITRIQELRVDLGQITDQGLEQHLGRVLEFIFDCLYTHSTVSTCDFAVVDLMLTCEDLLGWDSRKSLELLSGLSGKTTEPTDRLNNLAQMAQKSPRVLELLQHTDRNTPSEISRVDREFFAAFESYLQEFGCRTPGWEIGKETLAERPDLVLGLIRDQVARGYNPETEAAALEQKRADALGAARAALEKRSLQDREQFEERLRLAARAYPIREDHEFYVSNAPFALLRYALMEIGKRLTERRQIDRAEDVLLFERAEMVKALQDRADMRKIVLRRIGELAWIKAHPGPASYGKPPPPPPSIDAFPPEARRVMKGMLWYLESLFAARFIQQAKTPSDHSLKGLAASPGQYTGPVCVILNESQFGKIKAGDVLVCPTTMPSWSVLFPSVGALVTDSGGILSHPAIIAREYHVPAIVATGNATSLLRDGQKVTVDGSTGRVEFAR